MSGYVFKGAIVIVSPGMNVFIRVMHISRGCPFTSAEHEPHFPALVFQVAPQDVDGQEGPQVADVGVVIDGRSARIDRHRTFRRGRKRLDFPAQRIVEVQHMWYDSVSIVP